MKHKVIHVLEAIAHQGESMLFRELTLLFKQVKDMPRKSLKKNTLESLGISKLIARHTGIKTKVEVDRADYANAWVYPPFIDHNHVLIDMQTHENWWLTGYVEDAQDEAFKDRKSFVGTVNLAKGKITGDFTTYECPMAITNGLLTGEQFTPEMISAVVLHELGHVFTYFEYFGRVSTFNGALNAATEAFMKADSREDKLKIIRAVDGAMALKLEDQNLLANARTKEAFITVVARAYFTERGSSLGSDIYDMTLWESQADMFAVRMGAGKYQIQALHEIYKSVGGTGPKSTLVHLILTLIKVLGWFALLALGQVWVIVFLFFNPAKKIYDDPEARMKRLRNDMVTSLKSYGLSAEQKVAITQDIGDCDAIIAEVKDHRGLIEFFYTSVLPSGRRDYSQRAFQLEMEKLVANELLVSSTRLGALAKRL